MTTTTNSTTHLNNNNSSSFSNKKSPFLVKFKNNIYDLTEFEHKHPGGRNTLKGLNDMDMGQRFAKAPPHSDAAMYLLQEYKVKNSNSEIANGNTHNHSNNNNQYINYNNNKSRTTNKQQTNGHINNGGIKQKDLNEEYFGEPDESMEHLVDWNSAMVPQIASLGNKYSQWVNKPVDRPLRLFGPDYLENLTKTPWWVVPLFWIPAISYITYLGFTNAFNNGHSYLYIYWNFILGVFLWTITEYSLHRWVFHMNADSGNPVKCTFHFLIHGLHHKVPFDPYRLVFPPVPAVLLASLFYLPVSYLFNSPRIVIGGGLLGYLCYDMIHYYIHYGSPSGGYMYNLKRYHYQHHFVHHDKGFGISSSAWDKVLKTQIFLRKLKYILKW